MMTLLCLALMVNTSSGQVSKTLIKSFNFQGQENLIIELKGIVKVETWENTSLRVMMDISLESGSSNTLKYLIQSGRYNLKLKEGVLSSPLRDKEVKSSAGKIAEEVIYSILVPKNAIVELVEIGTTSYLKISYNDSSI